MAKARTDLMQGTLELLILKTLASHSMHGYGIAQRIHEAVDDLLKIESEQRFDFVYLPSVSRPDEADRGNPRMGRGRASNILRYVLEMPVQNGERDTATVPALPGHLCRDALQRRFDPTNTVILTCGNPLAVADIKRVGEARGIRVETEDW